MKKKDEDAFLKSVYGASPIKKNDKVEKKIQNVLKNKKQNKVHNKTPSPLRAHKLINEITERSFVLEKNPINKKLKKGKVPIDKKIDFHGYSVFDAETLFLDTIVDCYKRNLRCILFITGKGIRRINNNEGEKTKLYYGKIREGFLKWVKRVDFQKYILSVEQATMAYGADGAFFVYLRKKN